MKGNRLKVEIAQLSPDDLGRGACYHAGHVYHQS
jgi:hypothetical protein